MVARREQGEGREPAERELSPAPTEPAKRAAPTSPGTLRRLRTFALLGLLVFALLYTAYFARAFLLPIVLAFFFFLLLMRPVRWLKRLGMPEPLGAAVLLAALVGAGVWGTSRLIAPAGQWIERAPQTLRKLESRVSSLRRPVEEVSRAAEQVAQMADADGAPPATRVKIEEPGPMDVLFARTTHFLVAAFSIVILLYFLLASGDLFLLKLVRVLPHPSDKRRAVEIARRAGRDLSTYIGTVTLINACLGVAVGTSLGLLGLPNPLLWGVLAAVLNFVPYLGALVGVSTIALVSFGTFEEVGRALAPPAVYLGINMLEGNLVTPLIVGQRMRINPVMIFIGLLFWTWMWGIPGALLSVPILMVLKILCDHIPALAPVGEFLSRRDSLALVHAETASQEGPAAGEQAAPPKPLQRGAG